MNLFTAHNQWKSRPADERFSSLAEMHAVCSNYKAIAATASLPYAQVRVEAQGDELALVGRTGIAAKLTHWAMGQLSARAGAPASYLRELPTELAAQNLNHGLKSRGESNTEEDAQLLFHNNGSLLLRAALSSKYTRIWNSDVTARLLKFQARNPQWVNPMAYEIKAPAKMDSWPITTGKMVPSGLYASDHDMFVFLVDESRKLEGSPKGLNRGMIFGNSEVGASSFYGMKFFYDRVCGNNIIWGARGIEEFRIRHTGKANELGFERLALDLKKSNDADSISFENAVRAARSKVLGTTKLDCLETLVKAASKSKINSLTENRLQQALDIAETREDRYGNPRTLWAAVSGLTEASQWEKNADQRMILDRAAGKLMRIDF